MGQMKELFISMQEGLMQGITITNAQRERQLDNEHKMSVSVEEFNPDNEKHVEIMQETQQAMGKIAMEKTNKRYKAVIKWLDTGNIDWVVLKIGDIGEDDDDIFFYLESEKEIESFKKEGSHEWVIIKIKEENSYGEEQ